MHTLADASLTDQERRVVARLLKGLRGELGPHLRGVWLYGSRARGEEPGEYSDVDLIVVSTRGGEDDDLLTVTLAFDAAMAEAANPFLFSVKLYDPGTIAQRREIRSFFFQEVDRDKIVLAGEL